MVEGICSRTLLSALLSPRSFLQPLLGSGSLVWELVPGDFKLVDGSTPRSGVSLCENLCRCGLGCEDSGNQRSVGIHVALGARV